METHRPVEMEPSYMDGPATPLSPESSLEFSIKASYHDFGNHGSGKWNVAQTIPGNSHNNNHE